MPRGRWVRRAAVFGLWTLVGLFFSTQGYLILTRVYGSDEPFWMVAANTLPGWYVWAALSPAVARLARRYRVSRGTWRRALAAHALFACAFAALDVLVAVTFLAVLWSAVGFDVSWAKFARNNLILFFHWNVLVYAALVALAHAADYSREARDRERRALQLEAQLARARLGALQAQLHPHFLFNALNGIAELIHEDPAAAERMVLRLGELLRTALRESDAQEITLGRELEFVRAYLEVEQVRFQDRLSVDWRIDPVALPALVPALVLQPLVENALRHGVAAHTGSCRVTVGAALVGGSLRLEVSDTGPGLPPGGVREGLGLSNTRLRLAQLYGPGGRLELTGVAGGGAVAAVVVPHRAAPADAGTGEGDGGEPGAGAGG